MDSPRASDGFVDRAVAGFAGLRALRTNKPMPAEPMARLVAKLIDITIFGIAAMALLVSASATFGWIEPEEQPGFRPEAAQEFSREFTTSAKVYVAIGGAMLFLAFMANECGLLSRTGQSFARRKFDLHVVAAATLLRPPLWRMALRFLVAALPVAACVTLASAAFGTWLGLLGMLLSFVAIAAVPGAAFFRDDKRGLHDLAMGTVTLSTRHNVPIAAESKGAA